MQIILLILIAFFSIGIGGAAGAPPTLIAQYKMNEDTASDNDELITNGDFAVWDSVGGRVEDPTGWVVGGEVTTDPEISEVGTGEGHGGAGSGMCNIYTSNGTTIYLEQHYTTVIGRKYRVSITENKKTTGNILVRDIAAVDFPTQILASEGTHTWVYVATITNPLLRICESGMGTDVTIDNVSIKLCAVEDSSGNDHDGLAQQDTDAIHVTGKINGAFDFTPNDYIEIADHADFTPALTPFSISAWAYMHNAANFKFVSKGVFLTEAEWTFDTVGTSKLFFALYDDSENAYIRRYFNTAITNYKNQWIHLVATYDGGTSSSGIKIYLNGIRIDDMDSNVGSFTSVENLTAPVRIGRYSANYANGLIDNVMLFSVELSLDDVKRIYNNRSGTEIMAEVDPTIRPRRSASPLGLRARYEH